jgi:dTDP-4-amino-4,6-dideoxygalactose transaminase
MSQSSEAPAGTSPPIDFIDLKAQRRRLGDRIDRALARVLEHGQYIMGPEVRALEKALAAYTGAAHVITCSNGTDALVLALMAKGVGSGSAVIVPTFTFAATAEAVAFLGAVPIFADVSPESFNLDPASLDAAAAMARALGLNPVAAIPVDLFGQPADYEALSAVAEIHGLWLLADAAQAFGGTLGGRCVGTLAPITTTSFFPAKPLGCYGDGGAVLTDNPEVAAILDSLRVHGKGGHKYDNARIGMNGRLDTLQAAILLEKLAIFPEEVEARDLSARRYAALLDGVPLEGIVRTPVVAPGATSVWAQYTLVLDERIQRDAVAAAMKDVGVPTGVYYPLPLHRQTAYRNYPAAPGGLPVSDRLSRTVLSLPMHPYLDAVTQERVAAALRGALR